MKAAPILNQLALSAHTTYNQMVELGAAHFAVRMGLNVVGRLDEGQSS
jgi:hypothetical protein